MRRHRILAFSALLAVAALAAPAHAANVTVKLRISAGGYAAALVQCDGLSVPDGANGVSVLQAATSKGCIGGFKTTTFAFGTYVTCVTVNVEVCEQAGGLATFWAYYKNGAMATTGIDQFNAKAGNELALAYTNFATCPTYPDCPL